MLLTIISFQDFFTNFIITKQKTANYYSSIKELADSFAKLYLILLIQIKFD